MILPDFLIQDADGEVRIAGHRIRLIEVALRYDEGHSPEGIVLDYYPTLSLPVIHRAIAFYLENYDEVQSLIAANATAMAQLQGQPRTTPAFAELQRRLDAKRKEAS